jgi:hypothetical protein
LALTIPSIVGGDTGILTGMIGSRLAFSLNALILAWAVELLEAGSAQRALACAGVLALAILAHPYREIGLLVALGLYFMFRRVWSARRAVVLGGVLGLGAAIDAFWLVPLVEHTPANMIPVIRTTLDQTWRLVTDSTLEPYGFAALFSLLRLSRETDPSRKTFLMSLFLLPVIMGAGILFGRAVVVELLHLYQFDPARLIGEYYLSFLLLGAIGLTETARLAAKSLTFG